MLLEALTARGRTCLISASDLLETVASAGKPGLPLDGLLSRRPLLLTAALLAFHDENLRPAGTPDELADWVRQDWLPTLNAARPAQEPGRIRCWSKACQRLDRHHAPAIRDDGLRQKEKVIASGVRRSLAPVARVRKRDRRELASAMLSSRFVAALVIHGEGLAETPFWFARSLFDVGPAVQEAWREAIAALAGVTTAGETFESRLLEEKLASLRQFAYGASHEINNPLANISMRAEALLRGETDESRLRSLRTIHQQALRAHQMITDLMLFAHPPALRRNAVQPAAIVAKVIEEVLVRHPRREFAIVLEQPAKPRDWRIDPDQFAELALALINNAIEALPGAGEVRLEVDQSSGSELVVRCRDTGTGFDERVARHLFDPFFSGREAGRGLGFGLSRAWTIARSHGGSLHVLDRSPGKTCFEARFPRVAELAGVADARAEVQPAGRRAEAA